MGRIRQLSDAQTCSSLGLCCLLLLLLLPSLRARCSALIHRIHWLLLCAVSQAAAQNFDGQSGLGGDNSAYPTSVDAFNNSHSQHLPQVPSQLLSHQPLPLLLQAHAGHQQPLGFVQQLGQHLPQGVNMQQWGDQQRLVLGVVWGAAQRIAAQHIASQHSALHPPSFHSLLPSFSCSAVCSALLCGWVVCTALWAHNS